MIDIIRDREEIRGGSDGNEMIKSSLRARLRPRDVIGFNDVDSCETFIVKCIGKKKVMVYGRYYDASGVTLRRISFDTIARRIDLVAYMQKPLAEY